MKTPAMNRTWRTHAANSLAAICLLTLSWQPVLADVIGGIDFPDGPVSFADAVISFSPGPDVAPPHLDANRALGVPDGDAMALGEGGELVLQFVDNSLTTSGDNTPDLHVFEIGPVVELFNVAISTDLVTWIDLGDVQGQPTSLDIDGVDGVVAGTQYSYVRLTDILPNQSRSPFGEADIDAVGAISSAAPVPGGPTLALLGAALLCLRLAPRLRQRSS